MKTIIFIIIILVLNSCAKRHIKTNTKQVLFETKSLNFNEYDKNEGIILYSEKNIGIISSKTKK